MVKSQVLTGGRMKAGGVKFADNPQEAAAYAEEILQLEINGHMPRGVLVDPKAELKQEYYAGVVWDGIRKQPVMLFSDMGGIDIEEVAEQHPDHVGRGHLSNLVEAPDFRAKEVIAQTGVSGRALTRATPILARLARLFAERDMTLAEINPLGELEDGSFVALDAHMEMENEARPRQRALLKELGVGDEETRQAREATPFEIAGEAVDAMDHRGVAGNVTEFDGNLGLVIGAGGGSLTLFDAVRKYGGKPANYCEIGGNPSVAKAAGLAKLVLSKPGVDKIAVMMSIVSNTRVDIVARGVVKACLELGFDPAREDRDLPHPRRLGGRGLQDPREVRRRVLRPLGVDARGRAARGREDPGGGRVSAEAVAVVEQLNLSLAGETALGSGRPGDRHRRSRHPGRRRLPRSRRPDQVAPGLGVGLGELGDRGR